MLSCARSRACTHTHTPREVWEVGEEAGLWALRGHMLVGGRFERAYLRIQRAADCSCAEMIYIDTNWHTFWSYTLIDMRMCVCASYPPPHPVKFATARKLDRQANLHICMWRSFQRCERDDQPCFVTVCAWEALAVRPLCLQMFLFKFQRLIKKTKQKKKQNLSRQLDRAWDFQSQI